MLARVDLGLLQPVTRRGLGQIEVLGDLTETAVTASAQLNDLGLELRRERATRALLLSEGDLSIFVKSPISLTFLSLSLLLLVSMALPAIRRGKARVDQEEEASVT